MNNILLVENKENMKDCNWKYPDWEFTQEYINSDRVPIPPLSCLGCQYLEACKVRVEVLLNSGIEMEEADLETIRSLCEIEWVYRAYPENRIIN